MRRQLAAGRLIGPFSSEPQAAGSGESMPEMIVHADCARPGGVHNQFAMEEQ